MGYKILYDNQILFDPYTNDRITDTKLSNKINAVSYFDFTITTAHSLYSKIAERAGEVRIYFDNLILFKGEIATIEEDFEGNKSVSCNGVLDYLTATRVRPYSTIKGEQPLTCPSTFEGYFQWLIDQHNSNCLDSRKHFSVGVNQGAMLDKNNYIYRSSEQRPTTASEIEDKILNSAGGYLFVRYKDDLNILDLYADVHDVNTQIIDYGVNMIDFTKTTTAENQYTAVVATGYTPDPPNGQTDVKMKPITLEGCTDGGTPYSSTIVKMGDRVYDVEAVKRYGYHEYYVSNTDITTYNGLLYYACKTLNTLLSPALTISVKAVDLALIMGDKYKHLQLGQAVRIRSKPRKVDEYLMVNSINLDLMNPENTTFDLGASYDTLTGQQSAYLKKLNASINASLDTVSALGDNVKNSAKIAQEAKDTANTANINATYAVERADTATDTANSAVTKAEEATAKAETATNTANSAVTKAETATTKATDASTKASEATTKAEDAVTKATEATTKANLVEKKAEDAKSAADSAKQAADEANTAAGNAQASANNANQAANEAKNSADEANTAASNAQSTANSALSSAAQANKDVGNVKTQITEINKEITSVKQDASTLRDDLTGQITTVKETMEADYAKKSELSSTESALKTEISKSAAGIRTEVSQTYSTKKELETTTNAAATAQSTADAAKKAAESNASDLANAVSKFDGDITNLKDQIDGAIQTWFYDGIPNALTEPEVNWTNDKDRQTHLGDLYYDNQTGFCYRYMNQNGVYSWGRIQDTEVTKALSDAAKAQTTANSKKRIFVTTPKPPYDVGDLWVQGSTGDILRCQTPKIDSQAYAASDWIKASKYTDDTAVTNLSNTVERTYATKSTVNQLSDRIEQTVSSVEEVRTDASAANTAAANAKKAADNAASAAATAQSTASAAQTKATAAANAAATAQTAADKAKENATSAANAAAAAQSKANAAQTAADAAKANASAAQTAADAANADLVTAKQNLEDLQGRADATDTEIAAAKTAVSKAQTAADAANSAASKANAAAAKAQSTADTAKSNAATAQTKANEAATAASTAQSTADTAKQNAATAQTKANEAASAASTAQSTADTAKANAKKAQDDVNALKNRVTSAETKITQNSEAIALRATKTEVTSAINNIQVGGRNLVLNTGDNFNFTAAYHQASSTWVPDGYFEYARYDIPKTDPFYNTKIGDQITISFDLEMFIPEDKSFVLTIYDSNIRPSISIGIGQPENGNKFPKGKLSTLRMYKTVVLYKGSSTNTTRGIEFYCEYGSGRYFKIHRIKIELGNKHTDWSPAPEDLQADAASKANTALSESKKYTDAQLKITSDSITSTVSSTYAPKQYPDTRNDNNTPDWYFWHYPRQSITEFKYCSVIGLSGDTFCSLLTEVPWTDASGGYPKQTASVLNKRYWRVGTNGSTWGAWNDVTGLANNASSTANTALSTANTAKSTADTANSTANTVKNDLANLSVGGRNYLPYCLMTPNNLKSVSFNSSNGIYTITNENNWSGGMLLFKSRDLPIGTYSVSAGKNIIEFVVNKHFDHSWDRNDYYSDRFDSGNGYVTHSTNMTFVATEPFQVGFVVQNSITEAEVGPIKLEKGNKPTDWSPAPEDYSTTTEMQSSINQTAESIKSTVAATYVNNEALSSYATNSQLEQTSTSLTSRIQTTETTVSKMNTTVKHVEDYMTFARENDQPTLTIGSSSSSFRTKLTNTGEKFMQGDQTIMELDGITSTVKASRVQMGHYQWRDTGTSMQLVYIPE